MGWISDYEVQNLLYAKQRERLWRRNMGHYSKQEEELIKSAQQQVDFLLSGDDVTHKVFGTGAQKDVSGKPRFDLIPPEAMLALAETYALGAKKYSDRNWEKGIPYSACIGALKRHLNAFELGDMVNTADGGYEHVAHAMWWAVALTTFVRRGRGDLNDLPAYNKVEQ